MLDLLGVVPLSAEVDRLMGTRPLPFQIQLELTRPWWLLGLAVLPVLVYFFYRSLVDFARWQRICSLWLARLIVVLLRAGAGRAEPGPADPRAVRRLRRRPQRERRRRGDGRPSTRF